MGQTRLVFLDETVLGEYRVEVTSQFHWPDIKKIRRTKLVYLIIVIGQHPRYLD